jgi:photosystem II stability/assembly factor-like uncharacterized protein
MKRINIIFIACALIIGSIVFVSITRDKTKSWKTETKAEIEKRREKQAKKRAHIKDLKEYMNGMYIAFGEKKSKAPAGYLSTEYQRVKNASGKFKAAGNIEWIHRGPSNVGGRTRGLIVDPDDATHKTWYAGSATGGVWKTTDAGANWICLTDELPYQATTTLAMPSSDHNILYMGTGESFTYDVVGGGIFKSIDKGAHWEHLASTANNEDFRFINRIDVDPDNEDIILVATTTGIFKSIDGGLSWDQTYISENSVEDLVADSSNFNYVFASVNGVGILRSSNAGDTWEDVTNGFASGYKRIELAISPVNPQKIFASLEKTSSDASELYTSWDRGEQWQKVINDGGPTYNFLGGQGYYDNTIAAHPYEENSVYWGGVNLWKVDVTSTVQDGDGSVTNFDTINTASFLNFTPFTGNLFDGMNTGDQEDAISLLESDFVSIEIRFGPGMSQKAHRFYVPSGATSGVPYTNYTYQDYVDVPFEVWDVTNNRQLMCSFRDQERDGVFNLYERTGENYGELGREYLFINAVPYNASTPNANIAVTGGRSYKLLYFFWPTLKPGATWEPNNLPDSKIIVEWGIIQERLGSVENVTDAYGSFGGGNGYNQSAGMNTTSIPGFHPDHHELYMIPVNDVTEDFWILNANDGGLGISYDKGDHFTQIKRHYLTTQFYGVSKKPYRNEYIGGMQDNGTWQSPFNIDASLDTGFYFRIGGDGFETVWNHQDSNRIMGSVYNNSIQRSINHGRNWEDASGGIAADDGPFITRLTPVPSNNNIVFAVGANGIYKTGNFATTNWKSIPVGTGWIPDGYSLSWNQVEVSPANEQIVWAGAGMYDAIGMKMFVSTDQGSHFSSVQEPTVPVPAFISGIAIHPTQENTAYVLYSLYNSPKILRTTDLGETWEDITQVDADGTSANGFPNVGCMSLMVFPDSISKIWAGTQIGIMESNDNGESWHYLQSNLPAVSIFQMFIQDNQVVVATYGRGIWTYQYGPELEPPVSVEPKEQGEGSVSVYPNPTDGLITIDLQKLADGKERTVTVYSLNGSVVLRQEYDYTGSPVQVDLNSLRKGNYIISVSSGELNYSAKIILQ